MAEKIDNPPGKSLLEPGTLWQKLTERTASAHQCGALQSIETEYRFIKQNDIPFVVRTMSNMARKEKARRKQQEQENKIGKRVDPFLPYEEELFVGNISPTHLCLLNKFNVVDNHLLIVTRAYEEQTALLNIRDFVALWTCLKEINGLSFFNGGRTAGASQPHKHLQLLPFPIAPNLSELPVATAIAEATFTDSIGTTPSFPFRHAIAPLDFSKTDSSLSVAKTMLDLYHALLAAVGLPVDDTTIMQPGAYNLLVTKNWMLVVPRSRGSFKSIYINSLGFAGSFFVRDRATFKTLQEITPMTVLRKVGFEF